MPRSARQQADLLQNQVTAAGFGSPAEVPGTFFPRDAQQPLLRPTSLSLDSLANAVAQLLRDLGLGQSEPFGQGFPPPTGGGRLIPRDGGSTGGPSIGPSVGTGGSPSGVTSGSVSESVSMSTSPSLEPSGGSTPSGEGSEPGSEDGFPPEFSTSGGPGEGDCTARATTGCAEAFAFLFGVNPGFVFGAPFSGQCIPFFCPPSIGPGILCACFTDSEACNECCNDPDRGGRDPDICNGTELTFCCYSNGILQVRFSNCCTLA